MTRIAIVEDNKVIRESLMAYVHTDPEYRCVCTCSNAKEALVQIPKHQPQIVLMDIQLPGINGITAFRKIREDPATETIPVIAVTASAMTQDRQKIMAAGFEGYQSKPLNVKAFVQAIEEMLQKGS